MSIGSSKKLIFSLLFLLLGATFVPLLVGVPLPGENALFSEAELQQADEIAKEISRFMGKVTISPQSCEEVLSQLPYYLDRIAPLTDKLFSVNAEALDKVDSRKISDLSDGIQWIYTKCQKP